MTSEFESFPRNLDERRAELDRTRVLLLDAVEAARRGTGSPPAGPWSLAEFVYHLHLAETLTTRGLLKKLASSDRREPASPERLREEWERIRHLVGERHTKAQSPARVVPDGAPELDQALALLAESRRGFLQAVESASEKDLRSIILPHPLPIVGELIGLSWTSVTAFHELRHAGQIRDMVEGAASHGAG